MRCCPCRTRRATGSTSSRSRWATPAAASHVRRELLEGGHAAHDNGAILGDVNLLATASGHMSNVFDIGANAIPGGSLEDPEPLFTIEEPGVDGAGGTGTRPPSPGTARSSSWAGSRAVARRRSARPTAAPRGCRPAWSRPTRTRAPSATTPGREPSSARDAAAPAVRGGELHHPQLQHRAGQERALRPGERNYQAGTWVTDFTDLANAKTAARSDPGPSRGSRRQAAASPSPSWAGRGPRTGTTASFTSRRSPRA